MRELFLVVSLAILADGDVKSREISIRHSLHSRVGEIAQCMSLSSLLYLTDAIYKSNGKTRARGPSVVERRLDATVLDDY